MEKLRAALEVLKKYHFWILCGLIVLLSLASWFWATSEQAKQYLARKGQIESQLSSVGKISSNADHPSEEYIKRIRDTESGPLSTQVATASNRLYKEQRDANPLPKLFNDEKDQEGFKVAFEKIWAPMEDIEKLPPSQLDEFYRSRYRNHIAEHFPQLFDLIERRTVVDESGQAGQAGQPVRLDPRRRGSGPPMIMPRMDPADQTKKTVGIVDWVDADQKIRSVIDRLPNNPTTLDVMLAQEDLWVYETLLKVIRNTNDVGPDPKHQPANYQKPASHKVARIKQILAMDIGRDAVQSWTNSEKALFNLPAEGGDVASADPRGAAPAAPMAPGPTMRDRGGMTGPSAAPGVSPLIGRYVDDKGKPLADPTQQPYGEFRMMPIDLKVVVEQREIPRLLAECANSAMRIDVRAVRILSEEPSPLDLNVPDAAAGAVPAPAETRPAAPTMEMRRSMRFPGMTGRGPSGSDTGTGKGESLYTEESADPVFTPVPVEVQGIIYIYNPPRAANPGEAASGEGGQAPQGSPNAVSPPAANGGAPVNGGAATGTTAPLPAAANTNIPAPAVPANPTTNPPVPGGRK